MKNETAKRKESADTGILLDPERKSPRAKEFEDKLSALIVGQERAGASREWAVSDISRRDE
jgi:hypothetical protein